ncbi:MAG TPA: heavy metal translocating P-type ATPase [Oligoflexus sp.]|uniref:heavy metal translocating P-type ATPase n=1 Tax=Oligoflexus sp. TaxID=1971216 RepID=UPI002D804EA0|nr:heavy metal translocating P-type ATPase [Oligoflexus sp.]HET9239226.1 heavy metal translocating P-type ATPase [Oligoflexus sp.]
MDSCCTPADGKQTQKVPESKAHEDTRSARSSFRIPQMDCASEVSTIQGKLEGEAGIWNMKFDISNRLLTVNFDDQIISSEKIREMLKAIGLPATVQESQTEAEDSHNHEGFSTSYLRLALAGACAIGAEVLELSFPNLSEWIVFTLAAVAVLLSGIDVYKKGFIALSRAQLNINALMSIAVTGALALRQWPEAAMVMFLFAVAELIEAKAFDRARNAFRKLLELAPDTTTVMSSAGAWEARATREVKIGTLARVRPGERISLDGVIAKGSSSINQAPITGESVPVEKTIGDKVFAGTINEAAEIEYKTTSAATDSTLAKIVETVDNAQGARAPTQRFIDRFSKYYTPAVFFIALAVAILPPLFGGGAWFDWLYKALVLLVIACPCALVISTPVTIVSGLSGAAKHGVLIKGGAYLERGSKLKIIALDKTGTLTYGKPHQTDFSLLDGGDEKEARSIAASLASRSDHPVSQAIALKAQEDGVPLLNVDDFAAMSGRGTKGMIGSRQYFLANHRFIEEIKVCSPTVEKLLEAYEREGKTVTILATSERALAVMGVRDAVRPSSSEAIASLHKLGLKTLMLSGDNQLTAEKIAKEVGIDEAVGHLLPADKMKAIQKYSQKKLLIGMVGDGINDAPALASADIGFSMGVAGTDVAIETSDVAIMDDDLRKVPVFIQLSRKTNKVLKQNITVAIGIKAVFFVLTLMGLSTMWMAVFADTGASLLVVLNGLRLNR